MWRGQKSWLGDRYSLTVPVLSPNERTNERWWVWDVSRNPGRSCTWSDRVAMTTGRCCLFFPRRLYFYNYTQKLDEPTPMLSRQSAIVSSQNKLLLVLHYSKCTGMLFNHHSINTPKTISYVFFIYYIST